MSLIWRHRAQRDEQSWYPAYAFRARPGRENLLFPPLTPKIGKRDPGILDKTPTIPGFRMGLEFRSNHRFITFGTGNGLQDQQRPPSPNQRAPKTCSMLNRTEVEEQGLPWRSSG